MAALVAVLLSACDTKETSVLPDAYAADAAAVDAAAMDAAAPPADLAPDLAEVASSPWLRVTSPSPAPLGAPFPIALASIDGRPLEMDLQIRLGSTTRTLRLRRGRAALSATLTSDTSLVVQGPQGELVTLLVASERPVRTLAGELRGEDLTWDDKADVRLTADARVPAGAILDVGPGTRVLVDARVNLTVAGELRVRGTAEQPALFTRGAAEGWGGIVVDRGRASLAHTWLVAAGADAQRQFGHSQSQPVVFVRGGILEVDGGGVVDAPGKGYSSEDATVTIKGALVTRCDQGGEHVRTRLLIEQSHFLELPDADGRADDDDNDGLYLASGGVALPDGPAAIVRDSVLALGEDDGIDHNGIPLTVERVFIEGMRHEGIAASNGAKVIVRDSVIRNCAQGIEAGWGGPAVQVEGCTLVGNGVGLRWGDEYPWETTGTLRATAVIVRDSGRVAALSFWEGGNREDPAALEIGCSALDGSGWVGRSGNVGAPPEVDPSGCPREGARRLDGCPLPVGPSTCP